MGFQFAGKAVYTAVWVAAVSLFMELLGFSTQKWLTAGGLGTVLLTLAGREVQICPFNTLLFMKHTFWFSCMPNYVSFALFPLQIWILLISKPDFFAYHIQIFTNFLSSAMIHATRPFVVNEWIQTRIEGYEVSGTVEVCIEY